MRTRTLTAAVTVTVAALAGLTGCAGAPTVDAAPVPVKPLVLPAEPVLLAGPDGQDWEVALRSATWPADDVVSAESPVNPEPAEGEQWVILPVTTTYLGPGSGVAVEDVSITYVAPDGEVFYQFGAWVPDSILAVGPQEPGQAVDSNLAFLLPDGELAGEWSVQVRGSEAAPATVAAVASL